MQTTAQTITCPNCKAEIPLTDALLEPFREQWHRQFQKEADEKLQAEREQLYKEVTQEVQKQYESQLTESESKRTDLQRNNEDLERQIRRLRIEEEEKLYEEKRKVRTELEAETTRLLSQKDQQIEGLTKKIKELNEKATQALPQTLGEASEHTLETALKGAFPQDIVSPVPVGKRGADLLQKVRDSSGRVRGSILWECKNTKRWNDSWIKKLKDDRLRTQADLAVLATRALPPNIEQFDNLDGVWVVRHQVAVNLARVLRLSLLEIADYKSAITDKGDKMEALYKYFATPQFKQRVVPALEAICSMRTTLQRERDAYQALWSQRDQEIDRAAKGILGLCGDMIGITGISLPEVERLQLPAQIES